MKSSLLAVTLIGITVTAVYFYPAVYAKPLTIAPPKTTQAAVVPLGAEITNQPKIEVAFVLDTTGSMSGLIQGAKDNIWSIASSMASANSAPTIKMGLVAYRDRGDDYVTKVVDLSDDLDTGYGALMGFNASGGGDHPESVNKALYDAVMGMSWSRDQDTYRVIFLVGDAPPQNTYQDEMQFPEIVKLAKSKGIVINTIQCGNDQGTTASWNQIAHLGQGSYFKVEQSGGAVAVATPYDDQIANLSKELDGTRLFYGNKKIKEQKRQKVAATDMFNSRASSSSIARKAEFNTSASGSRNFVGNNELVDDISSGRVALKSIKSDELPLELQRLGSAEQSVILKGKAAKRSELKRQIASLSKQRSNFVKDELAKTGADKNSLDKKIYEAVKSQASKKGLVYEDDAPKY